MQNTTYKKILRTLAMILVLALALGCFAACDRDTGKDKDDERDNKGSSSGLVNYQWNGLHYELTAEYKDMSGDDYAFYQINNWSLVVADETTPDGVTDSQSYANYYKNTKGSNFKTISVNTQNHVSYIIGDYGDGTKEVRGFYVNGNHCWVMYISCYTEDYSDDFISVVVSGTIDKNYQYTPDNGNTETPGNTQQPSNPDPKPPMEDPANPTPKPPVEEPTPGEKNQHSFDGLTYYLDKAYNATNNGDYMIHSNGSTVIMVVSGEAPAGVTDSKSFAQLYASEVADAGYSAQTGSSNGVYYTVTEWADGTTEVRSFYLYNGYGWSIYATSYDYASESSELIHCVTSGVIDKNYQHNNGSSGGSSGNTTPPVDPGTSDTPSGSGSTTDTKKVCVYSLAPSDWGALRCWAWKDGGDDVFDAWPGEAMLWIGKYYSSVIPAWVDHVIINGADGALQTDDIAIEAGKNVWIIIHADGQYYSVFYSYPTNDQLAEMGY